LGQFGNQTGASALPHLGRKFPHGLRGDDAAFAPGESSSGIVVGTQKRHAAAFAFFSQRQRFAHGFFLALQPPVFHGPPGERFSIGRKLHFHGFGSSYENALLARHAGAGVSREPARLRRQVLHALTPKPGKIVFWTQYRWPENGSGGTTSASPDQK
jgi:hypothetical protein